ncbi:MAG TPA: bifunctional DNA-formamidopyrimidine glycosylase/DNA-(apurinic or apyrimidinic site) lyase [Candidatus Limnocylindrales bacterium]
MPELPEVETVRAGLDRWVVGRTISAVEISHPRSIRRHIAGARDFAGLVVGRTITATRRRGKFLWLPLDSGDAIVGHLGMSGQLLVQPSTAPDEKHLHIRFDFSDKGPQLRFVDQRTFGGLAVSIGGADLPMEIEHIAKDPLEDSFVDKEFVAALRAKRTAVKRALLDQKLISGVGNIYADEALWRARIRGDRASDRLSRQAAQRLLDYVKEVLREAIVEGGTSFDALYVNVNGESGYFDRGLNAYGREGEPCPRCGTPIKRSAFMNRSSFFCPKCQR